MYSRPRLILSKNTKIFSFEFVGDTNLKKVYVYLCVCMQKKVRIRQNYELNEFELSGANCTYIDAQPCDKYVNVKGHFQNVYIFRVYSQ